MKLCAIREGFGFNVDDHDPEILLNTQLSSSNVGDFKPFFHGRQLYFKPEDSPGDIVRVVPTLQSESLNSYIDTNHLSTFTGEIYYGFKTVLADEYRTKAIDAILTPLEKGLEVTAKIYGGPTLDNLSKYVRILREPEKWGNYGTKPDPDKAAVIEQAIKLAYRVYAAYGVKTKQSDFSLVTAINLVRQRTGSNYVRDAAFAFAGRLKHPEPNDLELVAKFIDLCEQQLAKMPGTAIAYDYVVAPRSSGSFNRALADRITKTRGSEFLEIGKRLGRDVTVDHDQLIDRARKEAPKHKVHDGKWVSKMKDPETKKMEVWEYDTENDFVDSWSTNEHNKLVNNVVGKMPKNREAAIKNQQYLDKRRYVKIYSDQGADVAAGKSVLLIDDNLVGGGTIELVYEILAKLQPPPKRIDVFVPLYLPNGSGR